MIRIAVFDDYHDFLHLIAEHFENAGITNFALYSDYKEFLDAVNDDTDIAIIDYSIKGTIVTGINLMREVFVKSPYCRVIMMSAYLDINGFSRCMNNGAKMALDKNSDNFFDDVIYFIKQELPILEIEHRLRS